MLLDTLQKSWRLSQHWDFFILTYDQVRDVLATSAMGWQNVLPLVSLFGIVVLHSQSLFIVFANSKGILARMMGTKVMNYLGEVSYAFFLLHFTIIAYHNWD